jgi:hypothetical protein
VTHPSAPPGANPPLAAASAASAPRNVLDRGQREFVSERSQWAGAPPACARCGKSSGFMRQGFRPRPPRRGWESSRLARVQGRSNTLVENASHSAEAIDVGAERYDLNEARSSPTCGGEGRRRDAVG